MPAAYPCNVLRAVAAADQHAALLRLLGLVQLAFVELHRAWILGLGAAGIEMDLAWAAEPISNRTARLMTFFMMILIER